MIVTHCTLHHRADQDELIIGKIRFKTFDLGGHETGGYSMYRMLCCLMNNHLIMHHVNLARKLWRDYFASGVDGVVFIVDAVDRARFPEAKKELDVRALHKHDSYPYQLLRYPSPTHTRRCCCRKS